MRQKIKARPEFILNEPAPKIKNGHSRKSVLVAAREFPIREQREKVNRLLLLIDTDVKSEEELDQKDVELLKHIAFEGAISHNISALRYNAILKLASFPSVDSLNILSWLAIQGEDHYIRSHALLALGHTGMELSIPILEGALKSKNHIISNAAKKALITLVNSLGIERVKQYLMSVKSSNYKLIEKIVLDSAKKRVRRQTQTKSVDRK